MSPEELYDDTDTETIEEWIFECESADSDLMSLWEQSFVGSLREQFDRKRDQEKPLSGLQLLKLKQIHDKVMEG